jgi:hypothetical protein
VAVSGHGGSGRGWLRAVVLAVTVEGEAGLCAVERRKWLAAVVKVGMAVEEGTRSRGWRGGCGLKTENDLWMGVVVRVFFSKGGSDGLEKMRGKGGFERDGFRVRVFFLFFFLMFQNCPPFCMCWKLLFISKNVARSQNLVPQLLSFFVNLIFLIFLDLFLININSNEKISDFKNNTLKVERVLKMFENLNSLKTC